jgi:aspartate/glutamate racemase
MTLLEKTYRQLRSAGLVRCAEAFSVDYLSKNKNWFSYQRCTGRDFSVDAAVQCLRTIRAQQLKPQLSEAQQRVLARAAQFLLAHLNTQHCVADVC